MAAGKMKFQTKNFWVEILSSTKPWQYNFEGETTAFIVESDGTTVAALRVLENSTAHSSFASNVRLMSAAPEMLDALRHIMLCEFNSMSSRGEMVRLARKAISRATGDYDAEIRSS